MARKKVAPEAPEVLEAVLERMRQMTREEWLRELARRPEGADRTSRKQPLTEVEPVDSAETAPRATVPR